MSKTRVNRILLESNIFFTMNEPKRVPSDVDVLKRFLKPPRALPQIEKFPYN
jgi:hypothetical protein